LNVGLLYFDDSFNEVLEGLMEVNLKVFEGVVLLVVIQW
jgi:hypothetical protein